MIEENKINEKSIIKGTSKNNIPQEIKQNFLKKKNPGFNLVSLKARQRLNLFKKILSKYEYKDYIRKCKNMYSISSVMNNNYSISELYLSEKKNMPDILSIYNKIDTKLNPKKIKFKKINKSIISSSIKDNMSLSHINIFENNYPNNETIKYYDKNFNLSENNFQRKNLRNKTINYNIKKLNFFTFRHDLKRKSFIEDKANKKSIQKIYYKISNTKRNNLSDQILSNSNKKSLNSVNNNILFKSIQSERSPTNLSFSPLLPKFKIQKAINKKNNNINKIKLKKITFNDNKEINNNLKIRQYPLSTKNKDFSITHYGAIIYKNSILRKKGIENFLPQYYNLPMIYSNINMIFKNK